MDLVFRPALPQDAETLSGLARCNRNPPNETRQDRMYQTTVAHGGEYSLSSGVVSTERHVPGAVGQCKLAEETSGQWLAPGSGGRLQ